MLFSQTEDAGLPPLLASGLLLVLSTVLLVLSGGGQSLIGADEGYYAQMAREMVLSGQWLVPTFLGVPFFEKPPLIQWLMALSYTLFGVSDWSARLPSYVAGVVVVQMTYWLGRQWIGGRTAWWGGLILCGTYLWLKEGRVGGQDMILTALELVGLWCLVVSSKKEVRLMALGWGLAIGLGLLLKSAMIILAVIAVLPWLLLQNRRHQLLQNPYLYLGLGLGLLMTGLWVWASYQVYGETLLNGLVGKVVGLGAKEFHAVDPFYYFWNLPVNTFPWALFALVGLFGMLQKGLWERCLLLWSYPLVFFLLLQLFATKTPYYLLQIVPFVALLAAMGLEYLTQRSALKRNALALQIISIALVMLAILLIAAAVTLYVNPELLPEGLVYRPIALGLGIIWLIPFVLWLWQRWFWHWEELWLSSIVAGPVVALLTVVLVTSIGDYSPQFKAFCLTQWPSQIRGPVDIAYEKNGERVSEFIALAFYTPTPGQELQAEQIRKGAGRTWWLSPETRQKLEAKQFKFQVLNQVQGWTLATR